jgi:hypothetical protein
MICCEKYRRQVPWVGTSVTFPCQLPQGHDGQHSWEPLRESDLAAQRQPEPKALLASGVEISVLLSGINDGDFDPYLENILAVAHERKRALRGRRTFGPV